MIDGRYLTIRRDQVIAISGLRDFIINNLKVYQTPNLLKVYQSNIQFTSDTSAGSQIVYDLSVTNLIQNLD